jgi:hypothetical protein
VTTPADIAARAAERERKKLENERAYREGWHASGKAKFICATCRKSPFDGVALWRRGENFFCEEHAPAIEPTPAKPKKIQRSVAA